MRPNRSESPTEPSYVCFAAQDWWYHNQAHSDFQLMRSVARTRKVLVVNSIGMRMPLPGRTTQPWRRIARKLGSVARLVRRPLADLPNFHVMSPLPLPFYGTAVGRRFAATVVRAQVRAACLFLGIREPVVCVTIPTAWDVARGLRHRSLVYNRSDLHSAFPELAGDAVRTMEAELLRAADHVLYASQVLMRREEPEVGGTAHFLDHGVDVAHFRARPAAELPDDLVEIPRPRIGYFGAFDDTLIDLELLERVAVELPEASLVLVGSAAGSMTTLTRHDNVHWLGHRHYAEIPAYGSGFDVALIAYRDNSWSAHVNPIKLKEYLALGLPVVSTPFGEAPRYADRIAIADSPAEYIRALRATLALVGADDERRQDPEAEDWSWDSRAARLVEWAEESVAPHPMSTP